MKFYVHRTPTIMSGPVIRWNPAGNLNAEISASRDAVCISGFWDLNSPTDIAAFRTALAQAEEARHHLACRRTLARYENELELPVGADWADVVLAAARADNAVPPDDTSRCAVCQWPLVDTVEKGCVRGNCSMRPMPERWYSRERYEREQAAMIKGVPQEQRNDDLPVAFTSGPLAACTCTPTAHGHLTSCPRWRA